MDLIDEGEIAALAAAWGEPVRVGAGLTVGAEFWEPWGGKWGSRRGEVMFLLPRPGGLLLHRKAHYPPDAWRLLTGGIERGETIREAIAREPLEEVGLALPVLRYVAVLRYEVRWAGQSFLWATHVFLLAWSDAPLRPSHDDEIAETCVVPLRELPNVADHLDQLPSPWRDWGRFRATAHRLVQQHVRSEEVGPDG